MNPSSLIVDGRIFRSLIWRKLYISGLWGISRKIALDGENRIFGFRIRAIKTGQAPREFNIPKETARLFGERGIRLIHASSVGQDEIFKALRCALRMTKQELYRGFKVDSVSVSLSKVSGVLAIKK